MNEQLYKKIGRKYEPIGYSDNFTGFPCDGIWVVYSKPGVKSEMCIGKVGEFKNIDYSLLSSLIKDKKDKCCEIIQNSKNKSISEMIDEIFIEILK